MKCSHIEKVSNLYNKRHASDFARKSSEKKYLEPWGLSLKTVPPLEFGNTAESLSANQQFRLFSALHFVKYRLKKARQQKQRERYYKIYLAIRNRGIACNFPLVPSCVKKHLKRTMHGVDVDIAYLFEQGYTALIAVSDGFDPWYGCRFSTYACTAIKQSFYRRRKRIPIESIDIAATVPSPSRDADEEEAWWVEQLIEILNSDFLTERERKIIAMRFGCYGNKDNLTLKAAGQQLGMSKERVRQIQHASITKLKTHLLLQVDSFQNP